MTTHRPQDDELQFVRFVERNEHEGETWTFWLQASGNESDLDRLDELIISAAESYPYIDDFPFQLLMSDQEPESIVDKLVEYAHDGYMADHNKVVGRFTCPREIGEHGDTLYKGDIALFFKVDP